jgi:hypothetical protein
MHPAYRVTPHQGRRRHYGARPRVTLVDHPASRAPLVGSSTPEQAVSGEMIQAVPMVGVPSTLDECACGVRPLTRRKLHGHDPPGHRPVTQQAVSRRRAVRLHRGLRSILRRRCDTGWVDVRMLLGDSQVDILTTRHLCFDALFATARFVELAPRLGETGLYCAQVRRVPPTRPRWRDLGHPAARRNWYQEIRLAVAFELPTERVVASPHRSRR